MGKLMFLLYFILSVFPADATENRRHIHVVRRGSKNSHRGDTVAKIWIEENGTKKIDMCKYKDTNLGIKKLDFNVKRGAMAAYLTDGREIIVPISMFPDIKQLSKKQREDYMIMDDQYFSFESLSKIYSVKDLLRL